MGYLMAGAFFDCFEVVAVAKKSEKKKGKKKKSKRGEGNEEEGKIPLYSIYATAGMIISSVHLDRQCG